MFRIEYKIITEQFEEIENITDEDILYRFLMGNVSLSSSDATFDMGWEWIPLLDFAYCMQGVVRSLKTSNVAKEYFEFTENAETLELSREREHLKIAVSFSSTIIEIAFSDFEKAVYDFHFNISEYIRRNISSESPRVLQKYLSVEVQDREAPN